MSRKLHTNPNCKCFVCKAKRGEYKGENRPKHKIDCQCGCCRAKRGGSSHFMYGIKKERNPAWKGDDVGYAGLHTYIRSNWGRADCCENPNCSGTCMQFEWSKKDHNTPYTRDRKDYQKLCKLCHRRYDKRNK